MLLYLLTRKGTSSTVRDCVGTVCRDFISKGHSELLPFLERCQLGQALLSSDCDSDSGLGLAAVSVKDDTAILISGITMKLGYTDKPACDLAALLEKIEKLKQTNNEKAVEFLAQSGIHLGNKPDWK